MTLPVASRGANFVRHFNKVLNARSSGDVAVGDVLQFKPATYDGISMLQPVTANGLLGAFGGIAVAIVPLGEERNKGAVKEGEAACKYKNTSLSVVGSYAIPVTGQDYLTHSPEPTNIILLTDQTTGTDVHTPEESPQPEVRILANVGELSEVKTLTVEIPDISDTSSEIRHIAAPGAIEILAVRTCISAAITVADAIITVKNGVAGAVVAAVTIATAGSAVGTVDETKATAANAVFARNDVITVETDEGSTTASLCIVSIDYIELKVR